MKKVLITGITGQDGSYLAEFLLKKGYEVHGIKRRSSSFNTGRIDNIFNEPQKSNSKLVLHYGDLTDSTNIIRLLQDIQPDEIYNLAAQSHVKVSFEIPEYTADTDALGVLRILEAIRILGLEKKTKFYQASTSEMFSGKIGEAPQNETTPFHPRSPYGVAKLYAYWITVNYREAYNMFACNGVLFNHECVSENTPIIIRDKNTEIISIKKIRDIKKPKEKGKNIQQWIFDDIEIWDGEKFTELKCLTATKRKDDLSDFDCKIVNSRHGIIEVTNHHNMLDRNQEKVKTRDVVEGSKLLHGSFPIGKSISCVSITEATFLGMMVGDGYVSKDGKRGQFSNNSDELIKEIENLWTKISLGFTTIREFKTEYGKIRQVILNGNHEYLRLIRNEIYTSDSFKKVPDKILNADKETQLAFLRGYNLTDGLKSNNCTYEFKGFKTNSIVLAQGLLFLISQTTNQDFNITFEEDENNYGYYSINILSPVKNLLKEEKEEVKKTLYHRNQPEWVFDIEVGSGKFMGGVGNIVIANSPRRGETFVTRKITRAVARISLGLQEKIYLGNLDAKRDWGHSKDSTEAMWLILQQDNPDDYVIATGQQHSVRDFCNLAFREIGIEIDWQGSGVDEKGINKGTGDVLVEVDPRYFRPSEVESLLGDSTKAREKLGWSPKISFESLVKEMVECDLKEAKKELHIKNGGYKVRDNRETQ